MPDPLAKALARANEHQPIISSIAAQLMVKVPMGRKSKSVDLRIDARTGKAVNDMLDAMNRMNAVLLGGANPSRLFIS